MARKNLLVASLLAYLFVGITIGVVLGLLLTTIFSADSNGRFEARVILYRMPSNGTNHAARDFISTTLAREGFLEKFITKHKIDAITQAILTRNLSVVAGDASLPIAEMRLVGDDVAALTKTLDALVTHLNEELRSVGDTKLQLLLSELDDAIETANERNFELVSARFKHGSLPTAAESELRVAAALAERRNTIELAKRYTLKPLSIAEKLALQERLDNVIKEEEELTIRANRLAYVDSEDFKFASSLASAGATLKALRKRKQTLLIEFKQDTPLRVTGRAKALQLETTSPPTVMIACVGGLIGGLIGAVVWSLRRAQNSKPIGVSIEERIRVPVLGVIAQKVTDFGERELRPIAASDPQCIAMAGVHSLNVALHFLMLEQSQNGPVVFAELGENHFASHVIANLAIVMVQSGDNVLVIEACKSSRLLSMFENGEGIAQSASVDIRHLNDDKEPNARLENSSIRFTSGNAQTMPIPVPLANISHFDRILINAGDPETARKMLKAYKCGVGLVLCVAETRVSKLRKALANTLHGVVLCAASINEANYGSVPRKTSKKKSARPKAEA